MTEVIIESLKVLFISMGAAALFAPPIIWLLYRLNQVRILEKNKLGSFSGTNDLFRRIMNVENTNGTPNMGGLLILVTVPLVAYFLVPMTDSIRVLLLGFIIFGVWGLIDVIFVNSITGNQKLKALQETFEWRLGKFLIATALGFFIIHSLYEGGALNNTQLFLLFVAARPVIVILSVISQFAVYAAEVTDGLDGLLVGIFGIILSSLAVLLVAQGQYVFVPIIAIIIGVVIVDLYFNIPPARFFNGGPGAMPLGFTTFIIALLTDNLLPYFLMTSITWLILASSMIQILSMKFLKKRVFKIAPIHHHFQAMGWPSYKVVMRFWLFTVVTSLLGILIGLMY